MSVIVGFTGTREGMTKQQSESLFAFLKVLDRYAEVTIYHGACVGADTQVAEFAAKHKIPTVAYPAFKPGHPMRSNFISDQTLSILPPLERNKAIVDAADLVIGCTKENTIKIRKSGTCYTIRYALKQNKHTYVIYPNGQMLKYSPGDKNAKKPRV